MNRVRITMQTGRQGSENYALRTLTFYGVTPSAIKAKIKDAVIFCNAETLREPEKRPRSIRFTLTQGDELKKCGDALALYTTASIDEIKTILEGE